MEKTPMGTQRYKREKRRLEIKLNIKKANREIR